MAIDTQQIQPERNPGLIARVWSAIVRQDPALGPQPTLRETTSSGVLTSSLSSLTDAYFRNRMDRQSVYQDADEMDDTCEEVSVALDVIADNTVSSDDGEQESFVLTSEDTATQAILDEVCETADLHREVFSLVRNLVKYGDMFAEVVVNGEGQITQVRQLPPNTMHRNQLPDGTLKMGTPVYDSEGNCQNKPGECAYEQRNPDSQQVVAAFYPSQIIHTRLNWDGFTVYGRSQLRVTRMIWRKLKALDESVINARLIRAYPKFRHKVDSTGLAPKEAEVALKKYIAGVEQNRSVGTSRRKQYSVESDVFLSAPKVSGPDGKLYENASDIDILEAKGDTITNIDDVKTYFHRKMLSTLRVPPALLGWEEQVNARATVMTQDIEYVRFLRRLQQQVGQALGEVFYLALVLAGRDPESADYDVSWPTLNVINEAAEATAAQAYSIADHTYLTDGVVDAEWIQRNRFEMDDDEIAALTLRVDAEQAEADAKEQAANEAKLKIAQAGVATSRPTDGSPAPGENTLPQESATAVLTAGASSIMALEKVGARIISEAVRAGKAKNGK